ncbi:MAG: PQQ-binding-like beta-propeller repeat protein, partial [Methanoregula sp.]|nr:PQQ-binding-like beta-propeller repeat protein [Methanoregula sp.]
MKKNLWIFGALLATAIIFCIILFLPIIIPHDKTGSAPIEQSDIPDSRKTLRPPDSFKPSTMLQADPAHTGDYTNVSGGIIPKGQLKWKLNVGSLVHSSPIIWNRTVYIISQDIGLNAVDSSTGSLKWTKGRYSNTPVPAIDGGILYSSPWQIEALDAETGEKLWDYYPGNSFDTPTIVNGIVYAGNGNDNVYAFNAKTGDVRWNFTTIGDNRGLAISNDTVYLMAIHVNRTFASSANRSVDRIETANRIYALNAKTGALKWKITPPGNVSCGITIANGTLYAGADNNFYAFDARNGEVLWSRTIGYCYSAPAVANGFVYVGSDNANLYALNAENGTLKWNYTMKKNIMLGGYSPSPSYADGVVYAGGIDGNLYALEAKTGTLRWNFTTGGYIWSSPA